AYTFREKPDDYLLFLGRLIPDKGVIAAIEVARQLDMLLIIAGAENDYYLEHVKPLVDNKTVKFVGEVHGSGKDRLLGGARALIYPLQRGEPFGLVQIEAMLCGTPVAAINIGAVPEIVDEGVT